MRVALADDSALFRHGLAALLTATGVEVVGQTRDGTELLALVETTQIDIAILDIRMPPTFTNEGLRIAGTLSITHPDIGILVLSTYNETAYSIQLLQYRAHGIGYLLKDRVDDVITLLDALHRIRYGQSAIDPDIVSRLVHHQARTATLETLTERERAVLAQMGQGRSNAGIGQALHLSPRTVEAHVASIFTKLKIPASVDDHRRVLAVLTWLDSSSTAP